MNEALSFKPWLVWGCVMFASWNLKYWSFLSPLIEIPHLCHQNHYTHATYFMSQGGAPSCDTLMIINNTISPSSQKRNLYSYIPLPDECLWLKPSRPPSPAPTPSRSIYIIYNIFSRFWSTIVVILNSFRIVSAPSPSWSPEWFPRGPSTPGGSSQPDICYHIYRTPPPNLLAQKITILQWLKTKQVNGNI